MKTLWPFKRLAIIAVIFAVTNSGAQTPQSQAEAALNRGLAAYVNEDYNLAIREFTEAIRLSPTLSLAYYNRGIAHYAKKDYDHTFADFTDAIRLNPSFAEAYYNRGVAYNDKKDYDRAIADFSQSIRLSPKFAEAYYNRGVAYFKKGDYDRAIADYNQAIRLNPNFVEAYDNRGVAYAQKDDINRAIVDFESSLRINPGNSVLRETLAEAYSNRGNAHYNKGDYDRAIADFTESIRLNPNQAETYRVRGIAYSMKNDYDNAIADLNQAIRLNPNSAKAYTGRGLAYMLKKDYDRATADLNQAIRLNPDDTVAQRFLGVDKKRITEQKYGKDNEKNDDISTSTQPFSLSKLQNGWKRITIDNIGNFDIPPTMELQQGEYRKRKEELIGEDPSPFQIIVQQKGLNDFTTEGASKYVRVMFKTDKGSKISELTLDFDVQQFGPDDIAELKDAFVAQITNENVNTNAKLLEWYPLAIEKINGMSCIHIGYKRQINNNMPVIVHNYTFFNYYYEHTFMLSYRESEKKLWEKDLITILKSLRIRNKYKEL